MGGGTLLTLHEIPTMPQQIGSGQIAHRLNIAAFSGWTCFLTDSSSANFWMEATLATSPTSTPRLPNHRSNTQEPASPQENTTNPVEINGFTI